MPRAPDRQLEERDRCHLKPWLRAENTLGEASHVDWRGEREACRTGSVGSSELLGIQSRDTAGTDHPWQSHLQALCVLFFLWFFCLLVLLKMKGKSPTELVKSCSNADVCFLLYLFRLIPFSV